MSPAAPPLAAPAGLNRLLLSATLVERGAVRYTPAGVPALDLKLQHAATVTEDGRPRQVSLEIKAVALGEVTQPLVAMALGSPGIYAGFLATARNGRGLLFHITTVQPDLPSAATATPN